MALSLRLCLAGALLAANLAHGADLIAFWDARPRHGVNIMNRQVPDAALYRTARAQGVEWVRLAYDKWQPAQRDFLIGNADRYQGLVAADLATLRRTLDAAHAAGIKVVIAPLSLPGMRWRQNNGNRFDGRLWQDKRYWQQSADFWRDLAQQLKDHPAVAAYNLVNEPAPEKGSDVAEDASLPALQAWYRREQGGARDLPAFYRQLTAAIRSVDAKTPIMLDGSWYASARGGLAYWPQPSADSRTLYAYHMYEPYAWSNPKNHKQPQPWRYPGVVAGQRWDKDAVAAWLAPAHDWARAHGVPASRMVAAEFGCHRRSPGCAAYLEDVLQLVEEQGAHWAVYAWREDAYDGYDYELGDKALPWQYWQAQEQGKPYALPRGNTPQWQPIARRLAGSNTP